MPVLRVHGGFPELVGVHLAESLVSLHRDLARNLLKQPVAFIVAVGVVGPPGVGDAEERRLGNVQIAVFDQRFHLAVEEGEQQRTNVRPVHVGIGHDDDATVANLGDVEVEADAAADGGDDIADGLVGEDFVDPCFLDVQNLAAEGQDGLEAAGRGPAWRCRRPSRLRR